LRSPGDRCRARAQVVDNGVLHFLLQVSGLGAQPRHAINDVDDQVEARRLVQHRQLQRRVDVAFLPVTPHVQVFVPLEAVGEPVDEPRITVNGT
jgi:hypothetical protein